MRFSPARASESARTPWTLRRAQRLAFQLSLVLFFVAGALLATVWSGPGGALPVARASGSTATFYGADTTRTLNAIAGIWPQYNGAYCGIVTAEAAVNYDDEVHGVRMAFGSRGTQTTVASANRAAGASRWGYATPTNPYAGVTNIGPDFGTDPRSIAYMTYNYTPANTFFHDTIYRWQLANTTQPSFTTQVAQATTGVARALETWHEPVNVTINGGRHSVLVTGIFATTNPATSFPAQITSVVYRDPEAAASVSRFQVDFSTWVGGRYSTPYGVYSLWSVYYGDRYNRGDRLNSSDPEPTVGIYRPSSAHPAHWYGGFTWIQRDSHYANGTYSPDFAFSSTGALLTTP